MSLANPPILDWNPAEVEESVSTPCGGEHIRRLVLPTTPRTPTGTPWVQVHKQEIPPKTPRTTSTNCGGDNTPTTPSQVIAIQELLKAQRAETVQFIQDSMLRHEAAMISLITADTWDRSHKAGDMVMNSNNLAVTNQCMNMVEKTVDVAVAPVEAAGSAVTTHTRDFSRVYQAPHKVLVELMEFENTHHHHHRVIFGRLLHSSLYDASMTVLILFNCGLIIVEADANAGCHQESSGCAPSWLFIANLVLLGIYTCESIAVIDVYRWKVLADRSRLFELFVVISGYLDILILIFGKSVPSLQMLKLIRLTRLLRGLRLFNMFPELHMIVLGFISSMRTMVWGFVLLMLVLIIWSIGTVELLQDVNKKVGHDTQFCEEAFDSVWNATILLFQIAAAGDEWGTCTIGIIKRQPLTFPFFAAAVVAVQIGFLNLIMSVIIERVEAARASDTATRLRGKQSEMRAMRRKWAQIFTSLDADGNGVLTLDEVIEGFEEVASFREDWALLGIMTEDLPELFYLIDENQDERVTIDELLELLHKLHHSDRDMQQILMSMHLRVMAERLESRMENIETNILPSILQVSKTASVPRSPSSL